MLCVYLTLANGWMEACAGKTFRERPHYGTIPCLRPNVRRLLTYKGPDFEEDHMALHLRRTSREWFMDRYSLADGQGFQGYIP